MLRARPYQEPTVTPKCAALHLRTGLTRTNHDGEWAGIAALHASMAARKFDSCLVYRSLRRLQGGRLFASPPGEGSAASMSQTAAWPRSAAL
jgi:hypothetical protein